MTAELITDVSRAAAALKQGKLVAFGTETVYGLGANLFDPHALAGVFEAKNRPHFDPLIVHLADAGDVDRVAAHVPAIAENLIERFWPGPLTLVLPKRECVPDLATAGLPTTAVRVPEHPQARELIRLSGVPVAAPSANLFGRVSPTTAGHVFDQLGERIDFVLDTGPCRIGVESTVLQIVDDAPPTLLRHGGVSVEEIEAAIGAICLPSSSADEESAPQTADEESAPQISPGRLSRHYAPMKPLLLIDDWRQVALDASVGAMSFRSVPTPERFGAVEILSPGGSLREAAAGFFAALRRLEDAPVLKIVAELFPEEGLGRALNDRLRRAAAGLSRNPA